MLSLASTALSFLLSPVGRYVAVAVMLLAAYWAGEFRGWTRASDKCRAAAYQSRIDAMHTDLRAANEAAEAADKAKRELEDVLAEERERIGAYEKELAKRNRGACALDDDDVRMLLNKPNR